MIFNGGGFKTAMFLGMLKAAEEQNLKPDYIIGTCGGGIAAAVSHSIQDPAARLDFILSKTAYDHFSSAKLTERSGLNDALSLVAKMYVQYKAMKRIPGIFSDFLMDVPKQIDIDEISKSFVPVNYKTIIVASKPLYGQADVDKKRKRNQKLFQEVIFTDAETAEQLKNFKSPIANIKGSTVVPEVDFVTGAKVNEAARASISDPFYLEPANINDSLYITGAIDLYPVELAKALGDEIILLYPGQFSFIEQALMYSTYNYSQNSRHQNVFTQNFDYIVDYSDFPEELVFTPMLDWKSFQVISRIPKEYETYQEIVKKQYEYGYTRMLEAIKYPGSKEHIRNDFYR